MLYQYCLLVHLAMLPATLPLSGLEAMLQLTQWHVLVHEAMLQAIQ
jgi:hypothetical protein